MLLKFFEGGVCVWVIIAVAMLISIALETSPQITFKWHQIGRTHRTKEITNYLVPKMSIELITSPLLNSSAQKNHSTSSLTLMNINIIKKTQIFLVS
jgi:hypothetical protein